MNIPKTLVSKICTGEIPAGKRGKQGHKCQGQECQEKIPNPHLEGYKKCYLCGRYYELGVEHPCWLYHKQGGRRRQGWSEARRIKEKVLSDK